MKACSVLFFFPPKLPIRCIALFLQTVSEGDTERSGMLYKGRLFHMKGNIRSVEYFSSNVTLELAVEEPECHHYNIWVWDQGMKLLSAETWAPMPGLDWLTHSQHPQPVLLRCKLVPGDKTFTAMMRQNWEQLGATPAPRKCAPSVPYPRSPGRYFILHSGGSQWGWVETKHLEWKKCSFWQFSVFLLTC